MKIGFFNKKGENGRFPGEIAGGVVYKLDENLERTGDKGIEEGGLEILAPVNPSKIVAVGMNYRRHAAELNSKLPGSPLLFLKPPSSILPHKGSIIYPPGTERVDYEAELAVVIGKKAKTIEPAEVKDYILGFTAFNDVTARDLQAIDGQWTRAKGFDTFSPIGPFIETKLENPQRLKIQSILNGSVRQDSNTADMIFGIDILISFISKVMTLYPGDVIATGTPEGISGMKRGDKIIIRIEGLDDLVNTVG